MSILEFKEKCDENNKNIPLNNKLKEDKNWIDLLTPHISHNFYLCSVTNYGTISIKISYNRLIKLDKEDIDYFKNKYFPKLNDEKNVEIEKIKSKYNEKSSI